MEHSASIAHFGDHLMLAFFWNNFDVQLQLKIVATTFLLKYQIGQFLAKFKWLFFDLTLYVYTVGLTYMYMYIIVIT